MNGAAGEICVVCNGQLYCACFGAFTCFMCLFLSLSLTFIMTCLFVSLRYVFYMFA